MPGVAESTTPLTRVSGVPGGTPVFVASGNPHALGFGMHSIAAARAVGGGGPSVSGLAAAAVAQQQHAAVASVIVNPAKVPTHGLRMAPQ